MNSKLGRQHKKAPLALASQSRSETDHIAKENRVLKRQKPHIFSSHPRVGSVIRANFKATHSVYLLFDDPEMSQLTFIFLLFWILFLLFIHLSYIFIKLWKVWTQESFRLFNCDNRRIETYQLLITSLHSQ